MFWGFGLVGVCGEVRFMLGPFWGFRAAGLQSLSLSLSIYLFIYTYIYIHTNDPVFGFATEELDGRRVTLPASSRSATTVTVRGVPFEKKRLQSRGGHNKFQAFWISVT